MTLYPVPVIQSVEPGANNVMIFILREHKNKPNIT